MFMFYYQEACSVVVALASMEIKDEALLPAFADNVAGKCEDLPGAVCIR